ncbi:nicotinate-nucleotide--dimethylbenzimidazole phosphoribosyltransferase [Marinicrinis sediminis]|uniref:Nicotinate-nucleotide--dimethylbenzimidazole phosphoribosyltransferase n=1 Tax=Marinicrinis sediminis TaxID=1652465 RepID=A0ABW5R5K6_9BACL
MSVDVKQWITAIAPLDEKAMEIAALHVDQLTKPQGSLGKLEQLAIQLAGMTGELHPDLSTRAVMIFAADHGVCEEGVSAYPQDVTAQMVMNFLNGGAAINVLSRQNQAEIICVDIGIKSELQHTQLYTRKIRKGTRNLAKEPAMTREEAEKAVLTGIEIANEHAKRGIRMFATGEMGIGNTTASAALFSAFSGLDPVRTTGRGTGVDNGGVRRKQEVIRSAIHLHEPNPADVWDVLHKLGGLEIAGLTGLMLGAAANRCPVVIDGFISSVAAYVAIQLTPAVKPYLIASHLSAETGHRLLLEEMGLSPMLHLDMRLGEGTGAVLCFPLVDAACRLMKEMATFERAGVSREEAPR